MVLALMASCGLYDGSGTFAARIGVPAKSGVGGGIMAAIPGRLGIATYGPLGQLIQRVRGPVRPLRESTKVRRPRENTQILFDRYPL